MTLQSFYSFYNLEELDIVSIKSEKNKLYILIEMPVHIDYIANGYRPEFDLDYYHLFIFSNYSNNINQLKPTILNYHYDKENNELSFIANNQIVTLKDSNIEIIKHYKK